MGITCERCRKVHFISTSPGIKPNPATPGMYLLTCKFPCPEVRDFRKEAMLPYRVSDEVFQRGYAEHDEYDLILTVSTPKFRVRK